MHQMRPMPQSLSTERLKSGIGFSQLAFLPLRTMLLNTDSKRVFIVKNKSIDIGGANENRHCTSADRCSDGNNAVPHSLLEGAPSYESDCPFRQRGSQFLASCRVKSLLRYQKAQSLTGLSVFKSGEGEIRTHGELASTLVFKTSRNCLYD